MFLLFRNSDPAPITVTISIHCFVLLPIIVFFGFFSWIPDRGCRSRQRQVHRHRHVGPGRLPEHVGAHVRAVRRHRVRRGQHGPDAAGRGQGRAGHDAAAPGRGRSAGAADAVRGQQGGRAGRVRRVRGRRRAPAARAGRTEPPVAVGQHRRGGRAGPSGRRRAPGGHGLAGGSRESAGRP